MIVIKVNEGWLPDIKVQIFLEDFNCGLVRYRNPTIENHINCPTIEKITNGNKFYLADVQL